MPKFENLSIGHRIAITTAIVILILLALALFGYLTGRWEEDENAGYGFGLASAQSQTIEPEPCMDEETRERIRVIFLDAIDDGLKEHIKHVFQVWMKDDRGQPGRAAVGVRLGVKAYLGSRASALAWSPPACPPK